MGRLRFLVGAILALAAFELVARFFYQYPTISDPDLGLVPAPGRTVHWCVEGCGTSHWQAHGLRRPAPYDPARPAVLAVGDSFTEALQVDDDETFAARLEAALGVPVLNVGHSAFGPADYLGLAPFEIATWRPRWTVITLKESDFAGVERGLHHFVRDGAELRTASAPRRPSGRLSTFLGKSAIFSFALYRWRILVNESGAEPPMFHAATSRPPEPPAPPVATPAEIVAALARAYDGRVTFVFLPQSPEAGPAEHAFDVACAGRSCVNMRGRFAELAASHRPPFGFANSELGRGHLNVDGHAAVATALAAELSGRDLL